MPLKVDRRDLSGPFDLIGDVHGCLPELLDLLAQLGYTVSPDLSVTPPEGRTAVFLGDLVDRGPDTPGVLRLVMGMVAAGHALCVCGNHDAKLRRALSGHQVKRTHGLEVTFEQLSHTPPAFSEAVRGFLAGLPHHLVLDGGRLVAAHAGLPQAFQGRDSGRVRAFALYGDTGQALDAQGLPLRRDWAADYHGAALVVYGHTPVLRPRWKNQTVNLDTGCVFGGSLTALRYPELETCSVAARAVYREPTRPFLQD
ncbi:metallophosphoesterase [Deinococcus sp. KNUC1210]|uniref:metallophosphoesterase n=1 Tax=Deinococcus sp. KNUC1210 TaxID=2917691 RepID=UPI001EF00144|nr:metallophosphoesterase [Deinococcus sp. KNUC1210]ULH14604.1 metallophosphoesterase [Deinococcus sp. KNUC1210]